MEYAETSKATDTTRIAAAAICTSCPAGTFYEFTGTVFYLLLLPILSMILYY
jgi:hypothetical protein